MPSSALPIPERGEKAFATLSGHIVHGDRAREPHRRPHLLDVVRAASTAQEVLVEAPPAVVPALRGARDLNEAREIARTLLTAPPPQLIDQPETLARFRELRERAPESLDQAGAKEILRELKAVGGDLKALRLALTGAERGPELWTVIAALPRDEALRRVDAAL